MSKKAKIILLAAAAALLFWFTWDAFNQPGVNDLKGGFEEVASYRNENNTGPIVRLYAVTVAEPENTDMEAYGNFMPHTKYGNTKVYFFLKGKPAPTEVFPGEENFPSEFTQYVIGKYEKDAMGKVTFKKF